jgi:hypothetical protein
MWRGARVPIDNAPAPDGPLSVMDAMEAADGS